jgi:putative oxidoreductase
VTVDAGALVVRLVLAAIFCAQGYLKTFGPRDRPHGRLASVQLIRSGGLPQAELLAALLGLSELVFGLLVGVGLLTRLAAVPLGLILVLAILLFKRKAGFVGGWDWPFAVLGLVVTVAILGGGVVSLDSLIGWSL